MNEEILQELYAEWFSAEQSCINEMWGQAATDAAREINRKSRRYAKALGLQELQVDVYGY